MKQTWRRPTATIVSTILLAAGCGGRQGTSPLAPTIHPGTVAVGAKAPEGSAALTSWPTWQQGGATGDFRVHSDPAGSPAPFSASINMCHSTDPQPDVDLQYRVDWGDGSEDQGFCRFSHVYPVAGEFRAVACVWDRIPAHAPGSCWTATVAPTAGGRPDRSCSTTTGAGEFGDVVDVRVPAGATVSASAANDTRECMLVSIDLPDGTYVGGDDDDRAEGTTTQAGTATVRFIVGCGGDAFTYWISVCPK